jgi:hypothetical protein
MGESIDQICARVARGQGSGSTGPRFETAAASVCKPNCELCGGIGWVRNADAWPGDPGFGKLSPCPNLDLTKVYGAEAGLDEKEFGLTWLNLVNRGATLRASEAVRNTIIRGYGFVYLWSCDEQENPGGNGLAKSLILKIAVAEALRSNKRAAYVDMAVLLDRLRSAFDKDHPSGDALSRIEFWEKVPILALDEFNRVNETSYATEKRYTLLNTRYAQMIRKQSITIIASNTPPEQQENAIRDRLKDGRTIRVRLTGKSARPGMDPTFDY